VSEEMDMRRFVIAALVALAVLSTGCGGEDGVSQAEHDLVLSELAVANQELALAAERLTAAEQRASDALADQRSAESATDAAEAEVAELEGELEELFTIDESEGETMERQQALAILGNLFVEFRAGGWSEETVGMFGEFAAATDDDRIIEQLESFAAAVAEDPDSEASEYEYGLLGFEIMSALEREVVDPFGR
jgi:hypothetical protein